MAVKESERYITALVDALKVLDLFELHGSLRLKDIVEITGLNKSRVIRICGTLSHMGFLVYNKNEMIYSLGARISALGGAYEKHNPLYSFGKPILEELALESRETCSIFIVRDSAPMCLVRAEGPQALRFVISEGARNTAWQGASSKLLLAFLEAKQQREIIQSILSSHADSLGITYASIQRELTLIKEHGFSFSKGQLISDVFGYSCPIYDYDGNVCAAISVTGPPHRVNAQNEDFILGLLRPASRKISEFLGAFHCDGDVVSI